MHTHLLSAISCTTAFRVKPDPNPCVNQKSSNHLECNFILKLFFLQFATSGIRPWATFLLFLFTCLQGLHLHNVHLIFFFIGILFHLSCSYTFPMSVVTDFFSISSSVSSVLCLYFLYFLSLLFLYLISTSTRFILLQQHSRDSLYLRYPKKQTTETLLYIHERFF